MEDWGLDTAELVRFKGCVAGNILSRWKSDCGKCQKWQEKERGKHGEVGNMNRELNLLWKQIRNGRKVKF